MSIMRELPEPNRPAGRCEGCLKIFQLNNITLNISLSTLAGICSADGDKIIFLLSDC